MDIRAAVAVDALATAIGSQYVTLSHRFDTLRLKLTIGWGRDYKLLLEMEDCPIETAEAIAAALDLGDSKDDGLYTEWTSPCFLFSFYGDNSNAALAVQGTLNSLHIPFANHLVDQESDGWRLTLGVSEEDEYTDLDVALTIIKDAHDRPNVLKYTLRPRSSRASAEF